MNFYYSGFADLIQMFINYRKASGVWNEASYGVSLQYFDRYCAENYPKNAELCQEMVDAWCAKRDTELNRTCNTRTRGVRAFIQYLQKRGLTTVTEPPKLIGEPLTYIPHAFTEEELSRFFHECDNIPARENYSHEIFRKITCPVFFRLLYSSGIRTTEARLLRRQDVNLKYGVLDIQKSKGSDQHYVALHETMTDLLRQYDNQCEHMRPGRTYFFERTPNCPLPKTWVDYSFRDLWSKANGTGSKAVAYDLRHNHAIQNINSWDEDSFDFSDKLHYLSKSMGHRRIASTFYYYSIVPRLAETVKEKTEQGFNEIVPEVCYEEE